MAAGFFGGLGPRYYVVRPQFPAGLAYPYGAWPDGYNPAFHFPAGFPAAAPRGPFFAYPSAPYPYMQFPYGPLPYRQFPYGRFPYGPPAPYGAPCQPTAYPFINRWAPWTAGYPAGYPATYPAGYPLSYLPGYPGFWAPPAFIAPVSPVRPIAPLGYNSNQAAMRMPVPPVAAGFPASAGLAPQASFAAPRQTPWSLRSLPAAVTALPAAVGGWSAPAEAWQRARDESGQWDRSAMN
ncbi:MAG: hypothetical protein ACYC5Y_10745 [Symbiobacteriia bacterium]